MEKENNDYKALEMLHYVSYHYNRMRNKKWCGHEDGLSELCNAHDSSTHEYSDRRCKGNE